MDALQTPVKRESTAPTLNQLYQSSIKKQSGGQRKCLLCLLCSADTDNSRCANPSHYTCQECTYEWSLDQKCPICKQDSFSTVKKPRRYIRSNYQGSRTGRNFVIEEFEREEEEVESEVRPREGGVTHCQ